MGVKVEKLNTKPTMHRTSPVTPILFLLCIQCIRLTCSLWTDSIHVGTIIGKWMRINRRLDGTYATCEPFAALRKRMWRTAQVCT